MMERVVVSCLIIYQIHSILIIKRNYDFKYDYT